MPFTLQNDFSLRVVPTGQGPVPAALVGNPGRFTEIPNQSSVSQRGVTFQFAGSHNVGTGGDGQLWVWNPPHQGGVSFTNCLPASAEVDTYIGFFTNPGLEDQGNFNYGRWINGAELNAGRTNGPFTQNNGYDGFRRWSDGVAMYVHSMNIDPGKTGVPINFAPGEEGMVSKAISITTPGNNGRPSISRMVRIAVVAKKPTVGTLGPGEASYIKRPPGHWNDATVLANLHRLPSFATNLITDFPTTVAPELLRTVIEPRLVSATNRPEADIIEASITGSNYASYMNRDWGQVALRLIYDIPTEEKRHIANGICSFGINIFEKVRTDFDREGRPGPGGYWGRVAGLGGVLNGFRMPLALTALLLQDDDMMGYLAVNRGFADMLDASDHQYQEVTQAMADSTSGLFIYNDEDVGAFDWMENFTSTSHISNRSHGRNYRGAEKAWGFGVSIMVAMCDELREVANFKPAMLAYHDRGVFRDFYRIPANQTLPFSPFRFIDWDDVDPVPTFVKRTYKALRASSSVPIWDWPA